MTETQERGADSVPMAEVKTAIGGFLTEFNHFQDDMNAKLQKQEERIAMLNTKTNTFARPALSTEIDGTAPHKLALKSYLRCGDDDALRGLELEGKALNTVTCPPRLPHS